MTALYRHLCLSFIVAMALVFACFNLAAAQNCVTSLGDPVVNVTFDTGTGYGPPLTNGITTLTPSFGCPGDDAYAIVSQCTVCYTDNWHSVTKDHTGDVNGRFMLINASPTPSDFYVQQVNGLCSGSTYQFSAWVLNMVKNIGTDPNLTFSIEKTDGTVLGTSNPISVPKTANPIWQQIGFTFTLPNGITSVILRMHNNAPGGLGNDLALDDITFRVTGPPITMGIQDMTGTSATVCQGSQPLSVFANVGACFSKPVYQWQVYRSDIINPSWTDLTNQTTTICPAPTTNYGVYQYRLLVSDDGNIQSPNCRVLSAPVTVTVGMQQKATLGFTSPPKTNICAGEKVTFNTFASNVGAGTPQYLWLINGASAPGNNRQDHYITKTLNDGDIVTCQLSRDGACSVPVFLDAPPIHVSGVAPNITITSSTNTDNLCKGTPVTFTVTTNQSTGIGYQWQVNGVNQPSTSSTFRTTDLQNNNIVACLVTSSTCNTPVSSDEIKVGVIDAVSSINIVGNTQVCPNTPVTFNADQIPNAIYQWQVNGQNSGTNSSVFTYPKFNNGDKVVCQVLPGSCSVPIPSNTLTMKVASPVTSVTVSALSATACKGTPVTFTATADQTTGISYQWLINGQSVTGTANTLITSSLKNNDVVICQVSTTDNCAPPVQSSPLTVSVIDPPQINIPNSTYEIYKGESAQIAATVPGTGLIYKWSPATGLDRTDVANPTAQPDHTTTYTLQVTNASGCSQTIAPVVVKIKIKDIVVPNSFTPNNDGVNDKWEIAGLSDDPGSKMQVFNRYGDPVFYSIGYKTSWDGAFKGKPLPDGVYYYIIRLSDGVRKFTGYITIIR